MQIKVSSNQSLFLGGESIDLVTYYGYPKCINIKYDGCSDDIKIDSNIRYNIFLIEELLNTKISKSMLPDEYIAYAVGGKKYNNNLTNISKIRHISDSLCSEYGLSVLDEDKFYKRTYTKSISKAIFFLLFI